MIWILIGATVGWLIGWGLDVLYAYINDKYDL